MIRYVLPLLLLTGCQGSGQTAYQQDFAYCSANGTRTDIETINACVTSQASARQAQQARTSAAMMQASAILLSNRAPPPTIQPIQRPVNCISRYNSFLNQMETNCR